MADQSDLDRLYQDLRAADPRVRMHALYALSVSYQDCAGQAALEALQDEHGDVRSLAARLVGRLQPPEAAPALVAALGDDDAQSAAQAAAVLGELRHEQAVPELQRALRSGSAEVRAAAARALGTIGNPAAIEPLTEALRDESPAVLSAATEALTRLPTDAVVDLLMVMLADRSDPGRENAATALRHLGPAVVGRMTQLLATGSEAERIQAAWGLGEIGHGEGAEALVKALDDPAPTVRGQAVLALGLIPSARAAEALRARLSDEDPAVRARTRFVLEGMGASLEPIPPPESAPQAEPAPPPAPAPPESAPQLAPQPEAESGDKPGEPAEGDSSSAGDPEQAQTGEALKTARPAVPRAPSGYWQPRVESPLWTWLAILAIIATIVIAYFAVQRSLDAQSQDAGQSGQTEASMLQVATTLAGHWPQLADRPGTAAASGPPRWRGTGGVFNALRGPVRGLTGLLVGPTFVSGLSILRWGASRWPRTMW